MVPYQIQRDSIPGIDDLSSIRADGLFFRITSDVQRNG